MRTLSLMLISLSFGLIPVRADDLKFERIVVDADFPGGYQVEVADVNGDKRPDIVALGGGICAWYENPSWKKRIITNATQTPGVISSATIDLDGDGKAEVAIAYDFEMNEPKRGNLLLAEQGATVDDPWRLTPIGHRPGQGWGSIHRLRWGNFLAKDKPSLIVAPIFGEEAKPPLFTERGKIRIVLTHVSQGKKSFDARSHIDEDALPVLHAIEVKDIDGDGYASILTASNLGVHLVRVVGGSEVGCQFRFTPLIPGASGDAPKRGSSEVHLGALADGTRLLATLEPWHGNEVVVYTSDAPKSLKFGNRTVIDDTLADGHALWVADVDKDGNDEIFAGHRGKDHRVSVYKYDGKTWIKTVVDREIAAQDLRGGDLDGDGAPDVVAIGGATHNVVWYRPIRKQ